MGYCTVGGKGVGSGMGGRVGQQGEERNAGSRVLGLGAQGTGVAGERAWQGGVWPWELALSFPARCTLPGSPNAAGLKARNCGLFLVPDAPLLESES